MFGELLTPRDLVLMQYPHAFAGRKDGDDRWAIWEGPKPAKPDGPAGRVLGQHATPAGAWRDVCENLPVYQDPMNQAIAHDLECMGLDPAPFGPGYAQLGPLLTPKQRVHQQYPAAVVHGDDDGGWTVVERPAREDAEFDHVRILGEGCTEAGAWQAAADNLPDVVTVDAEGQRTELRYKTGHTPSDGEQAKIYAEITAALRTDVNVGATCPLLREPEPRKIGKGLTSLIEEVRQTFNSDPEYWGKRYTDAAAMEAAVRAAARNNLSDSELFGPFTVTAVPKGPATTPPKPRLAFTAEQAHTLGRYGRPRRKP